MNELFSPTALASRVQNALLDKKRGEPEKSQGNLTGCLKKLLGCNLMISVSAKVLYHEALENPLRSGKNQGKIRENEN